MLDLASDQHVLLLAGVRSRNQMSLRSAVELAGDRDPVSIRADARRRFDRERGSVTAESALVLPLVAAFALTMVWMISLGIAQVRSVDAARDAARGLARGEDTAAAIALAERTAPPGARVAVVHSGTTVTVTVSARTTPPGWLLVPLPTTVIDASATVEVEDGDLGA